MKKLLLLFLVVCAAALFAVPAQAHDPAVYYNAGFGRWPASATINVHIVDNDSFWTQPRRDMIAHAVAQWDGLSPGPHVVMAGDWGSVLSCDNMHNDIEVDHTDIGGYGLTSAYGSGGSCGNSPMSSALVQIASDPTTPFGSHLTWYSQDCNDANDGGKISLCGIATHEFGHAMGQLTGGDGQGHFVATDGACSSPINSMCNIGPNVGQFDHTTIWKAGSLEGHDSATFEAAYS